MTGAGDGTGGAQQPAATPPLSTAFADQVRWDIPDGPSGPYRIILQSYRGPPPQPFCLPPRANLDDDDDEEEEEGNTAMSSVATLCNSAIGAGVLSLPSHSDKPVSYCLLLPLPTACYCL